MVCVQSGYKTITPFEIANCLHAKETKQITYRAVRVYFGCLAMLAVREAARRSERRKGRKTGSKPRYLVSELCSLTKLSARTVKKELLAMERASILSFSEIEIVFYKALLPGSEELCEIISGKRSARRPIPVPRSVLRFIARSPKAALSMTMLGYVLRGLSIAKKGGAVTGNGTAKAGWIANTFGLSLRSVRTGRKELIEMGFISQDTGSTQRKLNRDGSYFRINLAWKEKSTSDRAGRPTGCARAKKSKIAPPPAKPCAIFAPPIENKKTSNESKNQETQSEALKLSGVLKTNLERGSGPRLADIKLNDLKTPVHLEILFRQAVNAGWLGGSEANRLNWIAAAVRATTVAARDPVRVFVSLVKRARWDFITQEQEDRARILIRRLQEPPSPEARQIQTALRPCGPMLIIHHEGSTASHPIKELAERLQARQLIAKSLGEINRLGQS